MWFRANAFFEPCKRHSRVSDNDDAINKQRSCSLTNAILKYSVHRKLQWTSNYAIHRRYGGVVGRPRTSSGVASTSRRGAADSWRRDVATGVSRRVSASARLALVFGFRDWQKGKSRHNPCKNPRDNLSRDHLSPARGFPAIGIAEMHDCLRCLRGWYWWSVWRKFFAENIDGRRSWAVVNRVGEEAEENEDKWLAHENCERDKYSGRMILLYSNNKKECLLFYVLNFLRNLI